MCLIYLLLIYHSWYRFSSVISFFFCVFFHSSSFFVPRLLIFRFLSFLTTFFSFYIFVIFRILIISLRTRFFHHLSLLIFLLLHFHPVIPPSCCHLLHYRHFIWIPLPSSRPFSAFLASLTSCPLKVGPTKHFPVWSFWNTLCRLQNSQRTHISVEVEDVTRQLFSSNQLWGGVGGFTVQHRGLMWTVLASPHRRKLTLRQGSRVCPRFSPCEWPLLLHKSIFFAVLHFKLYFLFVNTRAFWRLLLCLLKTLHLVRYTFILSYYYAHQHFSYWVQ